MQRQTHLVVLVNGLWGWQRDWTYMKKALEASTACLIWCSAVNTGPQTYDGIDVCGHRLAQEVHQVVSTHPSLITISFIGHSMGGLIAHYAIGLLAEPGGGDGAGAGGTVAGLQPCWYISIASPHLGCSSSHPEEDRPYMRWLATAVAAGHLGGHEHLATTAMPSASHAAAGSAAATVSGAPTQALLPDTCNRLQQSNTGCSRKGGSNQRQHSLVDQPPQQQQQQQANPVSPSSLDPHTSCGAGISSDSSAQLTSTSTSSQRAGKSWPWTPCRSVVQLLGCDAWQPPVAFFPCTAESCSCRRDASLVAAAASASAAGGGGANQAAGDTSKVAGSAVLRKCCCREQCTNVNGQGPCCCSSSHTPRLQATMLLPRQTPPAATRSTSNTSSSTISSTIGSSNGNSGQAAAPQTGVVGAHPHLLDVLCADVQVACQVCGREHQQLLCMSGLQLFRHRVTYSSAGGDHLIPWSSSSLLKPSELPVSATQQAAAAKSANEQQQQQQQQRQQIPVLGFWSTRPLIVEQEVQPLGLEAQQHQQPVAADISTSISTTSVTQSTTSAAAGGQAGPRSPGDDSGGDVLDGAGEGAADVGVLSARLQRLQRLSWRRFHVVWPRLCLGSSHCNIQYNGPLNFVGRAVVEHVCQLVLSDQ